MVFVVVIRAAAATAAADAACMHACLRVDYSIATGNLFKLNHNTQPRTAFIAVGQMSLFPPLRANFLFALVLAVGVAASCPDVLPFRSSHVQTSFNQTKMTGLW
jgi:hypothetical protein